jgi:hypothetical protein
LNRGGNSREKSRDCFDISFCFPRLAKSKSKMSYEEFAKATDKLILERFNVLFNHMLPILLIPFIKKGRLNILVGTFQDIESRIEKLEALRDTCSFFSEKDLTRLFDGFITENLTRKETKELWNHAQLKSQPQVFYKQLFEEFVHQGDRGDTTLAFFVSNEKYVVLECLFLKNMIQDSIEEEEKKVRNHFFPPLWKEMMDTLEQFCGNCYSPLPQSPYFCPNCSEIRYCSEKCCVKNKKSHDNVTCAGLKSYCLEWRKAQEFQRIKEKYRSCAFCKTSPDTWKERMKSCPCFTVKYCNVICQKGDWKKHKKTCSKRPKTKKGKT